MFQEVGGISSWAKGGKWYGSGKCDPVGQGGVRGGGTLSAELTLFIDLRRRKKYFSGAESGQQRKGLLGEAKSGVVDGLVSRIKRGAWTGSRSTL